MSNTNKDLFNNWYFTYRWATHGVVNEANAHPISDPDGTMALVHNGIIENYKDLKQNLLNKGYKFKTDTDTEVLVSCALLLSSGKMLD